MSHIYDDISVKRKSFAIEYQEYIIFLCIFVRLWECPFHGVF